MDKVEIKVKKYSDVVLCDVPDTQDGQGVLIRLVIHDRENIIPAGKYQFAVTREYYASGKLQEAINEFLNPEIVKISDEDINVLAEAKSKLGNHDVN